jgi:hypothetical protein
MTSFFEQILHNLKFAIQCSYFQCGTIILYMHIEEKKGITIKKKKKKDGQVNKGLSKLLKRNQFKKNKTNMHSYIAHV